MDLIVIYMVSSAQCLQIKQLQTNPLYIRIQMLFISQSSKLPIPFPLS